MPGAGRALGVGIPEVTLVFVLKMGFEPDRQIVLRFVADEGGHRREQGGLILPDSLRCLWRDWKAARCRAVGRRMSLR